MVDLTIINLTSLKKDIFDLCNIMWPTHLQIEGGIESHIFHAIKIINIGGIYSISDVSKDKPVEISNKFLLFKIKEELESMIALATIIEETELEEATLAESVFTQEPTPADIEALEDDIIGANKIEEDVA